MIRQLRRSLSFRLLAIFAALAAAFVYFATIGIRWVYSEDDLRELISGHLSLHIDYVRRDIGSPPSIERATAITEKVPVDIRISGAGFNWASDPDFPEMEELTFGASDIFSEDPGALLGELTDVEFAVADRHRFLKIDQGDFSIVVSSPRISDVSTGPDLLPTILDIAEVDPIMEKNGWTAPPLPGESLVPVFKQDQQSTRELYFSHEGNKALRQGKWKAVISPYFDGKWQLFNMEEDRTELYDLSSPYPESLQNMKAPWVKSDHEKMEEADINEAELEEMQVLVPQIMSTALELKVPLKVDIKTGANWGEMD